MRENRFQVLQEWFDHSDLSKILQDGPIPTEYIYGVDL